jgi:hypothetical protein
VAPSTHGSDSAGGPAMNRAVPATPGQKAPATAIRTVVAQGAGTSSGTGAATQTAAGRQEGSEHQAAVGTSEC